MKKTKIVCTLGPASETEEIISAMADAGMNVARINFSHGTYEDHAKKIATIKKVRDEKNIPLPILLDTKGPEFRIKTFKDGKVFLKEGDTFAFTTKDIEGDETRVSVSYKNLPHELEAGDTVLVCRRLEGEFLAYRNAIPKNNPIQIQCDAKELLASLERVSLIISEKLKSPVRCVFQAGRVLMSAKTSNGEAKDICPIEGDGGDLEIGFNNRYLMEALRYAPADQVRMELNTSISPCIITPVEEGMVVETQEGFGKRGAVK